MEKKTLKSEYPLIAAEWDYEKNDNLSPESCAPHSNKTVWWTCSRGHSWRASIQNRTASKSGCPFCNHKLAIPGETDFQTRFPDIAKQWDFEKNRSLLPSEVLPFSNKKVWWKCEKGHSWQAKIENRVVSSSGCPICSLRSHTSFPEQALYYYLSKETETINRAKIAGWEIDVFLSDYAIGVEYDGIAYHSRPDIIEREFRKSADLEREGIDLIRIKEDASRNETVDSVIYYPYTQQYKYLDSAIQRLFVLLEEKTGRSFSPDIDTSRDRSEIQLQFISSETSRNICELYPEIAAEWDYEKNGHLKPEFFSYGSSERVWWKCSKCGHEWKTSIGNRTTNHSMCPKCADRLIGEKQRTTRLLNKKNYLSSEAPHLLSDWDYEKNPLPPDRYSSGSEKKVWWVCSVCGFSWEARIRSRVKGAGCPVCGAKNRGESFQKSHLKPGENDLLSRFPELAKEWALGKNALPPSDVSYSSHKNYWWICPRGHEYLAPPNRRVSLGSGCPYCAGKKVLPGFNDLASLYPDLLKEWDFEKNVGSDPSKMTPGKSSAKYWWKCSVCGYSWEASPNTRTRGHGCPVCSKKRKSK